MSPPQGLKENCIAESLLISNHNTPFLLPLNSLSMTPAAHTYILQGEKMDYSTISIHSKLHVYGTNLFPWVVQTQPFCSSKTLFSL